MGNKSVVSDLILISYYGWQWYRPADGKPFPQSVVQIIENEQ